MGRYTCKGRGRTRESSPRRLRPQGRDGRVDGGERQLVQLLLRHRRRRDLGLPSRRAQAHLQVRDAAGARQLLRETPRGAPIRQRRGRP